MTQEAAARKDTQRLQRAIVDGLEDVKGHDIQVFNTEHLSPLFERVIVASGTSNRQTKALASSVRDAVREAGFPKPRIEGEENGEWIIVDCGAAVAHIMQPAIRTYYHLEEIWGEKPVRLKFGAPKPVTASSRKPNPRGRKPPPRRPRKLQQRQLRRRRARAAPQAAPPAKTAAKAPVKKAPATKYVVPTRKPAAGKSAPARPRAAPGASGKSAAGKSATRKSPTRKK